MSVIYKFDFATEPLVIPGEYTYWDVNGEAWRVTRFYVHHELAFVRARMAVSEHVTYHVMKELLEEFSIDALDVGIMQETLLLYMPSKRTGQKPSRVPEHTESSRTHLDTRVVFRQVQVKDEETGKRFADAFRLLVDERKVTERLAKK